ncbi:MAG: tRNA (N(6)-L-threonylcarbamoyladenosine(37)-C(2))-methylthiotransferase MtaB [Christensenellaceae bacterium]|nr:tRNA (N(6)-L-threonylcarbamoyladenosine(37)-C(2))-methylthiotransferase MtaB [Christensenellaceae bacterium]
MHCCFITLGCRVNQYESDAMAELMSNAGYEVVNDPALADVLIVNTCTVTNIADRKSRQMLSRAHRLNENAKLVAVGCWVQRNPDAAAQLMGVDAVLGSADKSRIVEIVNSLFEKAGTELVSEETMPHKVKIHVRDVMREHSFEEMSAVHEGRTRAYLKIQDGCNMFCTYCAIPYARGAIRSRSLASVRAEAEKLNAEGYAEVVLTGIHLMSYGRDFGDGTNIVDAVRRFDGLDGIKRIRFGSLEPHLMTDEIITALSKNERICRHFHLSLQSGSDSVLERMRRGYTSEEYLALCTKLRHAFGRDTAITTDIIAGFPGETEAEHGETMEFMDKVRFSKVHIFPYSRRSGTKADGLPVQLTNAEKSRRAGELIAVGKRLEREYLEGFVGKAVEALIEKNENGCSYGCTDTYAAVKINKELTPNSIVSVRINGIMEDNDGELYLL